jgi:hypothetical protein
MVKEVTEVLLEMEDKGERVVHQGVTLATLVDHNIIKVIEEDHEMGDVDRVVVMEINEIIAERVIIERKKCEKRFL